MDFILETAEVLRSGVIGFISEGHSSYCYENRLKVARLMGRPPQMSNSEI